MNVQAQNEYHGGYRSYSCSLAFDTHLLVCLSGCPIEFADTRHYGVAGRRPCRVWLSGFDQAETGIIRVAKKRRLTLASWESSQTVG